MDCEHLLIFDDIGESKIKLLCCSIQAIQLKGAIAIIYCVGRDSKDCPLNKEVK